MSSLRGSSALYRNADQDSNRGSGRIERLDYIINAPQQKTTVDPVSLINSCYNACKGAGWTYKGRRECFLGCLQ